MQYNEVMWGKIEGREKGGEGKAREGMGGGGVDG